MAEDLKRLLETNAAETRAHFDTVATEMRRHFDVSVERLEGKIGVVGEAVAQLDEKVDRETESLRQEMNRGFSETQAMIKFSHAELDRRLRTLEEIVSDLQSRVERLEASAH